MARWVELIIVYDMDDTEKPLIDERQDWIDGNVSVADVIDDKTSAFIVTEVTEEHAILKRMEDDDQADQWAEDDAAA